MMRAAVLGSPISHSLSPLIHQAAYSLLGIDAEYSAIEMVPENLKTFLERSLHEGWRGFSLTMPLKESVFPLVTNIDRDALCAHSINTLVNREGSWQAYSTDLWAFKRIFTTQKFSRVAILGAGGTARAAAGALKDFDCEITSFMRRPAQLEAMQSAAGDIVLREEGFDGDLSAKLRGYDLLISTLPAGALDSAVVERIEGQGVLFDVLYHPWPTALALSWSKKDLPVLTGLDLLVEQALDQIALFSDASFDYGSMRVQLLKVVNERFTQ